MVTMESNTQMKRSKGILPSGFAGTGPNGSFFEAASWVDQNKPPGSTSQAPLFEGSSWKFNILSGKFFFFGPHFVWFIITLLVYFCFPYDFESAKSFRNIGWIMKRGIINNVVVFIYFGFWHGSLYILEWSSRPFNPNRVYKVSKVIHNMWYTFLGVVQYTILEAIFVHCYSTNRLPYIDNQTSFSSMWNISMFFFSAFWVPVYRDFHFYFVHRFIHIKALYKYVHSVHHRNTDIEPFSGLSMHPVEHLYYFSCVAPSLFILASPFALLWNGMHALLAPAAGHSGWEDHFSADQFHYAHHRFFECNYGTPGIPFDKMFGTFRDKLKETGTTYQGYSEEKIDKRSVEIHDKKANLKGVPESDFIIYILLNGGIWIYFAFCIYNKFALIKASPHYIALLVSCGPVVVAQVMTNITDRSKRSIFYPFHKDSISTMSTHLVLAAVLCVAPIYILVHMVLSQPGDSLIFWL